jgi:hypothetical protein
MNIMEKEEQFQRLESYFDRIKNTLELRGPSQGFIEEVRELLGFSHVISGVACSECDGSGYKVYGSTAGWAGGIGGQVITTSVCDCCWGSGRSDRKFGDLRKLRSMS